MESKEVKIMKLFFEKPTKKWHFEEIIKDAQIARSKANNWLKKFIQEKLIRKVKKEGKMPYYISNYNLPEYKNRKKIFALEEMHNSGLLNHLDSLQKVKTVIIFGSFSRSDWYEDSDIDIFIYGNSEGLKIANYEIKLHKDIQLFICKNKKDLRKLGNGVIKNIIKGNIIKGNLDFVEVKINA
ncbi:MAG: nucleotidyltransferase domain-containing protein [Nanoarchaeota archaeon]|nr:nucleotidyltransferase domain-containing protein [Nanoarchaeota archaeon]